ncbi:MAG: hypothetical protein WKF40_03935 [Thermoleophilaceae bacterium]
MLPWPPPPPTASARRPRARSRRSGVRWDKVSRLALLGTLGVILLLYISPAKHWFEQSATARDQTRQLQDLTRREHQARAAGRHAQGSRRPGGRGAASGDGARGRAVVRDRAALAGRRPRVRREAPCGRRRSRRPRVSSGRMAASTAATASVPARDWAMSSAQSVPAAYELGQLTDLEARPEPTPDLLQHLPDGRLQMRLIGELCAVEALLTVAPLEHRVVQRRVHRSQS